MARLVFGHPTLEFRGAYEGRNVVFGGCMAWGDERDPQWACHSCGEWWGAVVLHSRSSVVYAPSVRRGLTIAEMAAMWDEVLGR